MVLIVDGDTLCDDVESPQHDGSTGGPEMAALDLSLSNTTHNEVQNKMAAEETDEAKMADPTTESEKIEKPVGEEDAIVAESKLADETSTQNAGIESPGLSEPTAAELVKDAKAETEELEKEKPADEKTVESGQEKMEDDEEIVAKKGEDVNNGTSGEDAEPTQNEKHVDRWVSCVTFPFLLLFLFSTFFGAPKY